MDGRIAPEYVLYEKGEGEVCMVLGHYGLALCAKRFAPPASLGWLVFAAEFVVADSAPGRC